MIRKRGVKQQLPIILIKAGDSEENHRAVAVSIGLLHKVAAKRKV